MRSFFSRSVESAALSFAYADPQRDQAGLYRVDVALQRPDAGPLFVFAPSTDAQVRDATITLLRLQEWSVPHTSVAVFKDQQQVARDPLARLSDVVGKQFSTLWGNEERIVRYLREMDVPVVASAP